MMNRSYPLWLVGLALVFAESGCAADATSVATAIDETEAPIVQSSDSPPETPESEGPTDQRSSAMSSMAVAIFEPLPTFRPREEVLGPQPVPWCYTVICEAAICRCITTLIDRPVPIGLEVEGEMPVGQWRFEPR